LVAAKRTPGLITDFFNTIGGSRPFTEPSQHAVANLVSRRTALTKPTRTTSQLGEFFTAADTQRVDLPESPVRIRATSVFHPEDGSGRLWIVMPIDNDGSAGRFGIPPIDAVAVWKVVRSRKPLLRQRGMRKVFSHFPLPFRATPDHQAAQRRRRHSVLWPKRAQGASKRMKGSIGTSRGWASKSRIYRRPTPN
ncbi:hypothetical protein, partial [Mesorhizobium tianshanense]|uniref:hypothetical protein n=1 Tax=Mesorhizobium tianshanense TaxID=39844 RepID=UPI0024E10745